MRSPWSLHRNLSRVLVATMLLPTAASSQLAPRPEGFEQPLLGVPDDTGPSFSHGVPRRFAADASTLAWDNGGGGALRTPESYIQNWRVTRTVGLALAFNGVMTLYGRYIMKEPGDPAFVVSTETISTNLKYGYEWDDNSFSANNFRHPYQGALYFGAARANGYDFYQSTVFAFAGSWLWEYTGEGHNPAYNDMVNTTLGGISWGEVLFRLSRMITDNTATGSERSWREIGGFLVHPLRGANRILTGEAFSVHANAADRFPSRFGGELQVGTRTLGDETLWDDKVTKGYLSLDVSHGDPFHEGAFTPFEAFRFGVDVTFNNKPHGLSRLEFPGILAGGMVGEKGGAQHVLALSQRMDYFDNEVYLFGGQQLGFSWLTRGWQLWGSNVRTEAHTNWLILGGVRSDYANFTNREYDYGPGLGYILSATFDIRGYDFLRLAHSGYYVHSVNGNDADHYTNFTLVRASAPLRGNLSLAAQWLLYQAERHYADFPDVSARDPELKLFLSFSLDEKRAVH